ncbi:Sensor protein resE [sediment metagenome]|uniref:histidine kinase n=1 Tax=sediment metagenome TaxID=749907 RepID=D9PLA4_9ZZZZ
MQTSAQNTTTKATNVANPEQLKENFERIAQQMYTQNVALAQTNRTLSILRAIDLLILDSSKNLKQLGQEISKAVIEASPYIVVSIFSLDHHKDTTLSMQGFTVNSSVPVSTDISLQLAQLHIPTRGDWVESAKRNAVIDLSDQSSSQQLSLFEGNAQLLYSTLHNELHIHHVYVTKLETRNKLTGVMMVGLSETPNIDDIELIERLAEPTGIAIDNRLLFEENRKVVLQLQQMNDKLKEIDATKDEFISMASHQLRTPLTSMKGYVSMVLDGDVGEINDQQRTMLQQAFDSSQRMVYLISDLLNVSRLRTGKFTIANSPTNLADIVESELEQLQASADARGVKFVFHKPDAFPTLQLDETKVRQVIMNFLDNALYYTPANGRVTVELSNRDNGVVFTVTDSGLGVPKKDQPYLFTKFYRAQNARKMRPDGTGLGLYMARKIIIAQGGTILFNSQEGVGSTFGFAFPYQSTINIPAQLARK